MSLFPEKVRGWFSGEVADLKWAFLELTRGSGRQLAGMAVAFYSIGMLLRIDDDQVRGVISTLSLTASAISLSLIGILLIVKGGRKKAPDNQ